MALCSKTIPHPSFLLGFVVFRCECRSTNHDEGLPAVKNLSALQSPWIGLFLYYGRSASPYWVSFHVVPERI
jgi:hypothetical protein